MTKRVRVVTIHLARAFSVREQLRFDQRSFLIDPVSDFMFCPRCSQEQVNSDQRFCSRCGFPLGDVVEALSNEGYVDRNTAENLNGLRLRVMIGAGVMALSLAFFIVSLVLGTPEPSYVVQLNLLVTLIVFLLGLSWIGYSLWKGFSLADRSMHSFRSINQGDLAGGVTSQLDEPIQKSLRESYVAPASVDNTRDLTGSVTDGTTKLLERER